MNTALGNCLIMCALVHAYCKSLKLKKFSLINNGDDCVVIVERRNLARFNSGLNEWFKEMGFTMKVEDPVYILEKVSFCQAQPVFDGTSWLMVRHPSVAMAKDSYCIKPLDSKSVYQKWVGALGQGGASLSGGIPIMQEYYQCYYRASKGKVLKNDMLLDTGMMRLAQGMNRKVVCISDAARVSFFRAFDVKPDMQIEIEEFLRAYTPEWEGPADEDVNDVGIPWL
jgi:hypothetical protein